MVFSLPSAVANPVGLSMCIGPPCWVWLVKTIQLRCSVCMSPKQSIRRARTSDKRSLFLLGKTWCCNYKIADVNSLNSQCNCPSSVFSLSEWSWSDQSQVSVHLVAFTTLRYMRCHRAKDCIIFRREQWDSKLSPPLPPLPPPVLHFLTLTFH